MNKHTIVLPIAVLTLSLTACTAPKKDVAGLNAEIEAAYKGHYGQAQKHEEQAEHLQKEADRVLRHWQKDYYWNIDERQKALDAAHEAAQHRLESEKEMCQWLAETHGSTHHHDMQHHMYDDDRHHFHDPHKASAYFKTGSDVPHKADDAAIYHLGHFLSEHPEATALVTASTDTVGNAASNQALSERRAEAVKEMLVKHGAKPSQISTKATGKGPGPDHVANQEYRVATVSLTLPPHHTGNAHGIDCSKIK